MITVELKSQIDKVWEAFWTGGLSNPLTVIKQMTYLLFIRSLDEFQTLENVILEIQSPNICDASVVGRLNYKQI
jgi:hypothetical protein